MNRVDDKHTMVINLHYHASLLSRLHATLKQKLLAFVKQNNL